MSDDPRHILSAKEVEDALAARAISMRKAMEEVIAGDYNKEIDINLLSKLLTLDLQTQLKDKAEPVFRVGEKILCRSSRKNKLTKGKLYKVESIQLGQVMVMSDNGIERGYSPHHFIAYEDPKEQEEAASFLSQLAEI